MRRNAMLDRDFLYKLDNQNLRETFAKIVSLDFDENPIEEIEGRVSQGSISINGKSAVRRTCSLTLIANKNNGEEFNLHEYYWGLSQKIRVYIGLKNNIDSRYPEIIWFPQGVFLITQFNTSQSVNSYSISIQGKDKMALLNGEIGGVITSLTYDFGKENIIAADGTITTTDFLIKDIIANAVHTFAKEPFHNIIINDLDTTNLQMIGYKGEKDLFLIINQTTAEVSQMIFDSNYKLYTSAQVERTLGSLTKKELDHRVDLNFEKGASVLVLYANKENAKADVNRLTVAKCQYGDVIGYKITDLTYAGELIGPVGSSVTSTCLDKIVKMLGDFEYFYNLDGKFVFQRAKTYLNSNFSTIRKVDSDFIPVIVKTKEDFEKKTYYIRKEDEIILDNTPMPEEEIGLSFSDVLKNYSSSFVLAKEFNSNVQYYEQIFTEEFAEDAADRSSIVYSFENSNFITNFSNNPKLADIKNDFTIWGEKKSVDGKTKNPIHLRYAIDKKPIYYKNLSGKIFISKSYNDNKDIKNNNTAYDWREIIYQMAMDNSLHGHEDDFLACVRLNNIDYYPTGYTGYEQYYADLLGFWRELYNPDKISYKLTACSQAEFNKNKTKYYYYKQCKNTDVFNSSTSYYTLSTAFKDYVKSENIDEIRFKKNPSIYFTIVQCTNSSKWDNEKMYFIQDKTTYDQKTGWNNLVLTAPEDLIFWFDFLDTDGQLSQYSAHLIGNRPKAINNSKINSIYFREIPTIIFVNKGLNSEQLNDQKKLNTGYTFISLTESQQKLFTVTRRELSAKEELEALISQYAFCGESVSITSIPVYYLEPNTRIFARDDESGINGEYIISSISYNLGKGETMSISAEKAIERLY